MLALVTGSSIFVALVGPAIGDRPTGPAMFRPAAVIPAHFSLPPARPFTLEADRTTKRRVPRLDTSDRVLRDPEQFAALRAMPLDRGRNRTSGINAAVEWKLSGDLGGVDSQIGVAGLPRLIGRALTR